MDVFKPVRLKQKSGKKLMQSKGLNKLFFLDLVQCQEPFVKILPCDVLKGKMYGLSTDRVLLVKLGTNFKTSPL